MEICMKSLSGQGRKSPMTLFIIAVQFYGGRALCWDVPERNAQHGTYKVMLPLFPRGGWWEFSEDRASWELHGYC